MNRETRKQISTLQKSMNAIVKDIAKAYKYKVIGGQIWTIQNEHIFEFFPFIITPPEGIKIKIRCSVKPLYVDDYLWDILGMSENKRERTSLRVNGAFSLFAVPFEERREPLIKVTYEEVYAKLQNELSTFDSFLTSILGKEAQWFTAMGASKDGYYHSELMRLMIDLHKENYSKVFHYVQTHEVSDFIVGNKSIGELITVYCASRV